MLHFAFDSLWNMQNITFPSGLFCSKPRLQVGCDSSICRQWQICDHAICKERRVNARDENDLVRLWVDTRRISFRYSLRVLIGQLHRRLSLKAVNEHNVVQKGFKKKVR